MAAVGVADEVEEVSQHGTLNSGSKVAERLLRWIDPHHAFWTMCVALWTTKVYSCWKRPRRQTPCDVCLKDA